MGRISGSSCQTSSRKYGMSRVPVEAVCVIPKTEPVHSAIRLPITCCDDAVQDIDTEENYFIAVDMNSGYWQVVA